ARTIDAPCVDRKAFLGALLHYSHLRGPGEVRVARLPPEDRKQVETFGCKGGYALAIAHNGNAKRRLHLSLYRGNDAFAPAHPQSAAVLVKSRGKASLNIGWEQPWIRIGETRGWKIYRMAHTEKGTQWVNLFVRSGSLWVIPRQIPRGFFAYALAKTSVGHRLEMWRAAWALFLQHPGLGGGTGAFHPFGEEALGASAMAPIVGNFQHAHSDYLTSLGTQGIAGFLAMIIVLASPWLTLRRRGGTRSRRTSWPLAGAVLTGGMAVFGLTETMFVHSFVLSWFALATAVLLAAAMTDTRPHD
ncbi:MAG: O-antigen ligase family protein, partial [Gammaproteobacteria bacterium]